MVDLRPVEVALRRVERAEGRIARRNARRSVFARIAALRAAINAAYPPIAATKSDAQRTSALVAGKSWRQVEYGLVRVGRAKWDRQEAEAFNDWISHTDGHPAKPILFDIPDGSRWLGLHGRDAIRIRPRELTDPRRDSEYWRVVLHEIAHYRAGGHGSDFKRELMRVFGMWKAYRKGQR